LIGLSADSVEFACPLCHSGGPALYEQAGDRIFFRCSICALIFLKPSQRPTMEEERAHYDTHHNDPDDPRYRAWLARASDPLIARLPPGSEGLDFGCGPGPALARVMEEAGFPTRTYDPFFAPDEGALRRRYHWITATEVVEHLFEPGRELERLVALLRPGGWLALMTQPPPEDRPLANWRYARDPTHVCFFSPATFRWIAGSLALQLEVPAPGVALFHRPADEEDVQR
jgi:hypothetical protein